jgi:multiple sugar transport system permease protein
VLRKYNSREALAGYLFISPWIIGFLVFTVGAMAFSLMISFSRYNPISNAVRPVGTANYERLFEDPKVALSLANTLFYAVMAVPLEIILALLLALLLTKIPRGSGFFRTIFYLPKMTPAVATAAIFLLLLNGNTGAINQFLKSFGIVGPQWLIDPDWVKPSIVLMTLWGVSGTMVIFLAALKNVPTELYEASALDGAGPVRQFFFITVPQISSTIFFNVLVLTIAALQVFDQAFLLFWRDQSNASPESSLFYGIYLSFLCLLLSNLSFEFRFSFINFSWSAYFLIADSKSLITIEIGSLPLLDLD